MRRRTLLALAAAVLSAKVARAQGVMEAAVRAAQARAALRRGETVEAVRLFREAVALGAAPLVVRELAEALERQGALRAAAEAWTRYATLAPAADARARAIERRENLRRTPSLLRVRVAPQLAAREARVWFDHDAPRFVPVGGAESLVEGGSHRVRVEAPGYLPFETMVTTAFGEPLEVRAVLARAEAPGGDRVADGGGAR